MSTFWVNFLTQARRAISNSRGVAMIDMITMRQTWKLSCTRKPEINRRAASQARRQERPIHLGASDRKDLDTGSAALCKIVESDT
jgi:hypothetical protein